MNCKKMLSISVAFMYISLLFLGPATADGGIFGKRETLFYINENTQYAVIHHFKGTQRMIVSVNFDWKDSNKTAWILPVPSNPEDINIDIADGAPVFSGEDIIKEAREDLDKGSMLLLPYLMTAVVPLSPLLYVLISGMLGSTGMIVHKTLEKYGLTAEVVSATEGIGIYQYLADNGLEISEDMIWQLDDYVDRGFSFVVTWISDQDTLVRNPGIIIEFPGEDIFYPLILTSIYGTEVIPVELIVIGHVSPKIYDDIESYSEVRYWDRGEITFGDYSSSEAYNFSREVVGSWDKTFTSIEINAPSSFLTKDLWVENKVPDKVEYAKSIHNSFSGGGGVVTLYIIFSLLIGIILGVLMFGRKKEDIPFYLVVGGSNLVGIIGVIILTFIIVQIANKKRDEENKITKEKAVIFIFTFVITFIISMWLVFTLLSLPLS